MPLRNRLHQKWLAYGAYLMALAYVVVATALMAAKHNSFETRVYDFARFTQAIWNTLENGFLFETILYRSILGDHFSAIVALAAPLLRLVPDERLLFLIQALNVAVAGLLLYAMFRRLRPSLAPWFLLAFFLNPALHEVTLFEVRRIVFALPFLALALYALSQKRRWLMLVGLLLALLAKENVGFFVFMIGLYLLIFERDRKWGAGLMGLGLSWLVVISVWVIPYNNPSAGGLRPTSAWRPGERLRDVYYLTVPPDTAPGAYSLDVVVYDTHTEEVVPFQAAGEALTMAPVLVQDGSD